MIRCTVLFTALLAAGTSASAQWSPDLREGNRVRVLLPEQEFQFVGTRGQLLRGTVGRLIPDTLYLRIGDSVGTVAIPHSLVRRLDISRGVPSRASSAIRNGLRWGIVYALLGSLLEFGEPSSWSDTERAAVAGGVGLALGATLGAIHPVERWRRLRLEPRLTNTGPGLLGLGVALSW